MSAGEVIVPKSRFDRQLARLAQMRMWEELPACLDYLARVRDDDTLRTADRIRACQLIIERTIPTVQQIDMRSLVAMLPGAIEEDGSDEALRERRLDEAVRQFCDRQFGSNGAAH